MRQSRPTASPLAVAALVAVTLAALLATGCSSGDDGAGDDATDGAERRAPVEVEPHAARTKFAAALDGIATGTVPIGTGYGWIDVATLRDERDHGQPALDWAAQALGPGGDEIVLERRAIRRRTGVAVADARRLLSSAASFTLGVRIDTRVPAELARRLGRAASERGRRDGWQLLDLGPTSSIPIGTPAEFLGPFGARVALRAGSLVGARRAQSRRDLTGAGASPLDDPAVRLALACLGEVVAARIVPNNFTHAPNSGPELLAFGVTADRDEVLCATDPEEEAIADATAALDEAFADGGLDPVTEEPLDEVVARARVQPLNGADAHAARAELRLVEGQEPGFLFGTFVRGSLITYLGLPAPERAP